jgi:hypothetical protein
MNNFQVAYKKAPNKFQCLKLPLNDLLIDQSNLPKILSAVTRVNRLTKDAWAFLKLFILSQFQSNKKLTIIDDNLLKMIFKVMSVVDPKRGGGQLGEKNLQTLETLKEFYDNKFQPLTNHVPIDALHLKHITDYQVTKMLTAIHDNIIKHFTKFLKRYVGAYCKNYYLNQVKKIPKAIRKEIFEVNRDLLNGTLQSDLKFHSWILKVRNEIFPIKIRMVGTHNLDPSVPIPKITIQNQTWVYDNIDLKLDPQKYLIVMIRINLELETLKAKMFKWLPTREDSIEGYVPLDSAAVVDLLMTEDKKYYSDNISAEQETIWGQFFKVKHPILKSNNFQFNYRVETDGLIASVYMINQNDANTERQKKEKLRTARQQSLQLTEEQRIKCKTDKERECRAKKKANLELYKGLTQAQKDQIKQQQNTHDNIHYLQFPYFNELPQSKLTELKAQSVVFIDPGKRTLLTMMSRREGKPIYLNYTNRQRINETRRLKYQRLQHNRRIKAGILNIESTFKDSNKSCQLNQLQKSLKKKYLVQNQLWQLYSDPKFKQYRWYGYLNKTRSEAKLLVRIASTYGKDAKIIIGDWQEHEQMKYFMSTPGMGLKRLLSNASFSFQY